MGYFDCEPARIEPAELIHIDADNVYDWDSLFPFIIKDGKMQKGMSKKWVRVREHGKPMYVNTFPFTLDIETTNAYTLQDEDVIAGFMYHWAMTYDKWYITGRKWDSFLNAYYSIVRATGCGMRTFWNKKKEVIPYRLHCCVHNFGGFEWQFLRTRLVFDHADFFAKDERKVIYAGTREFVRFIDTYSISGASLDTTAKMWGLPTRKLTGVYDYNKPRNSKTKLSDEELLYIYRDVEVLHELWMYLVETYLKRGLPLPLTMTQRLRYDVKQSAYKVLSGASTMSLVSLFPDNLDDYFDLYDCLVAGGYNHASSYVAGAVVEDVYGEDFTSSYPAVMLQSFHFPVTPFVPVSTGVGIDNPAIRGAQGFCTVGRVRFYGLQAVGGHSVMSLSKSLEYVEESRGGAALDIGVNTIDNGRVNYAEHITFYLTDLDFRVIEKFYTYKHYEVLDCKKARCGHLPDYVRDNLFTPYAMKQSIKVSDPDHDRNPVYSNSKYVVCGMYGMMIEKPHKESVVYEKGSVKRKGTREESMSDYEYLRYLQFGNGWEMVLEGKRQPRTVFSPYWGVFVASIARYRLLCGYEDSDIPGAFVALGDDAIYGDTDSVYFKNWREHMGYFDMWNSCLECVNVAMIEEYNETHADQLDPELFRSLGTFEPIAKDGKPFKRFKTLGAKRYIKELSDGTIVTTVAGCPKSLRINGKKVSLIENEANKAGVDVFDFFSDGMEIPDCKNMSMYSDDRVDALVVDEDGNEEVMTEYSSVGIFPVSFKICMDDDYVDFLEALACKGGYK